MRLFRRAWTVSVGTLGLSAFDLRFEVRRTLSSKPNTAEIELYNLSETSRGQIAQAADGLVRLEAGYEEGKTLLFSGALREAKSTHEGVDWITKVSARDGGAQIRQARVLRSFGANARVEDVVKTLAETLGVGVGNASDALRAATLDRVGAYFPEGTVLSGSAATELDHLTRSVGLTWSVQDGVLQLLTRGRALQGQAVRLTSDTGLVDTPTVSRGGKVQAKALLIPDLTPGRRVQIESRTVTGVYRVAAVAYRGETRGQDWYADLECEVER